MNMVENSPSIAFITPSYRNDFDLVCDLCTSLDRFVRFPFEHVIIVPDRDLELFRALEGEGRRVVAQETILDTFGFRRLPFPTRLRIPFRGTVRFREQYYLGGVGRVGGWLIQQIIKLASADLTEAPVLVFVDSDAVLVRPLDLDMFRTGGRLTLQQHVRGRENQTHKLWRRSAHELLGIVESAAEAFNYIGVFIPWDRSTLIDMRRFIEKNTGKEWYKSIALKKHVSEYILYGEYVIHSPRSGDFSIRDMELYRSVWSPDDKVTPDTLLDGLKPHMVALHIQSTNRLPIEVRRTAIAAVTAHLAAQEGTAP
jgi:hypothetical protein